MINNALLKEEYPLAKLQKTVQQKRDQGYDVLDMTIGDPEDETCPKARQAAIHYLNQHNSSHYPKAIGHLEYRKSVADWIKKAYQKDYNPTTQIMSCNGTKEAIFSFPLLFDWKKSEKKIWIPELSYPVYKMSADYLSIPYESVPVSPKTNFLPDLDKIPSENWSSCGVFWINSPNNPSSGVASKSYLTQLLDLAEQHQFCVASDECYNDLYEDKVPASMLSETQSERWVVFRSLSKRSHMTGYRVGALISRNETLMDHWKRLRLPMGVGTSDSIQAAGVAAWNDESSVEEQRALYRKKRAMIRSALEAQGFDIFGGDVGFYFWLRHPGIDTSEACVEWFLNKGICVTPGTIFGAAGEGYVRMVYCLTMTKCLECIQRLSST